MKIREYIHFGVSISIVIYKLRENGKRYCISDCRFEFQVKLPIKIMYHTPYFGNIKKSRLPEGRLFEGGVC